MALPYSKEQIEQASKVNLNDYAVLNGYNLEKSDTKSFRVKGHGGLFLLVDDNRFYSHATGKSGGIIDFVMEYQGMSFLRAVEHLIGVQPEIGNFVPPTNNVPKNKEAMVLPDRAPNVKRAYWYLCNERGLVPELVSKMISERKIYQEDKRGNVVFIGYDEQNLPRYCTKRGVSPERPFKGDQPGSNKNFPFVMDGKSNRVYVLESPIDLLSHASLTKLYNIDPYKDHRISLGCLSDRALEWYLGKHPEIKRIVFALDNDADGKTPDGLPHNHGQEAARTYAEKYRERGYVTAIHTPKAKDFNEDLKNYRARNREPTMDDEEDLEH